MKQRVKIAAAIVHEPPVLLLDEPFNGADPRQRLQMMDMLRTMAADGCTIVFSSHILEEVERLAENVLVVVSGRLAASGDFRQIRRLMTDRPAHLHRPFDRQPPARLNARRRPAVSGVELMESHLRVRTLGLRRPSPRAAESRACGRGHALRSSPTDESLESVFSYLVKR